MDASIPSEAPFAWPYRADLPQRFNSNFGRYRAAGGLASLPEDASGFVPDGDVGDIARFLAFTLAFDQIGKEDVAGDVAELGVYRGCTAHTLATFARRLGRHTYLFDTFKGFDPADFTGVDLGTAGGFADTSLDAVRARVGAEATTYCQGHFPGTADQVPAGATFCLAHLDCDLYAPMLAALHFFYPRMEPGGFIVIHDYSSLAWEGAERAADLFFADKPECLVPMPDGCGSAIVRRERPAGGQTWQSRRMGSFQSGAWLDAGGHGADQVFFSGWSGREDWGRWGVGEAHTLLIPAPPLDQAPGWTLEIDAEALIMGAQTTQSVDIAVDDRATGEVWSFTDADNRGVRTVRIAGDTMVPGRQVRVTFHPRSSPPPASLDAAHQDQRPLGMAIHRLRLAASA